MIGLGLFAVGMAMSAFFSGSETGLYRVSRTRLVLDGLSGSLPARGVVWLLNHPPVFVATTLIGNNLANYLVSAALVYTAATALGPGTRGEWLVPMLMTPVVFVFGELLPKSLFFRAPYRLVSLIRPALLGAAVLFAPLAGLLGALGWLLQRVTGETPFRLRLMMGRGELDRVFRDGHEAGLLTSGQRMLAGGLFEIGQRPAISFGVPVDRLAIVDAPVVRDSAVAQARRSNHPIVLVRRGGSVVGFLWYADLVSIHAEDRPPVRPILRVRSGDNHLKVLLRMYDAGGEVALVLGDRSGKTVKKGGRGTPSDPVVGVVTRRQLIQPLMK